MQAQPVAGELEPKQQQAADGPVDAEMLTFQCQGCSGRFFDVGHYFYGVSSVRCTWCSKFPKAKNERKTT